MKKLFLTLIFLPSLSFAIDLTQNFNFDGYLLDSGSPVASPATIKFQIYDPSGSCLIFEETQSSVVVDSTTGFFSTKVGTGSRASPSADGGLLWKTIFQNDAVVRTAGTNCSSGYTPAAGDGRKLRVTVNGTALTPDYSLSSMPMATVAETLQGKSPAEFASTNAPTTMVGPLTLANQGEVRFMDSSVNTIGFRAPSSISGNTTYTWPVSTGSAGQALTTDGSGNLSWQTPSAGGITSLNGLTGTAQTMNIGTAGTAPGWSSGGAIHTLNIPMASSSGVTAGLLGKADFDRIPVPGGSADDVLRWNGSAWITAPNIKLDSSGNLSMNGGFITSVGNPISTMDAANKGYVDAVTANMLPLTGGTMTGNLTVNGGSGVTAGSFTFTGVGGTQIYTPGAGDIGINTSATERIRIKGSGNIGIGTSSPSANLDVNGTLNIGGTMGSPIMYSRAFPFTNCNVTSLAPGATTSCTVPAMLGSMNSFDMYQLVCHPYDPPSATNDVMINCYLNSANKVVITIHNIGSTSYSESNWNIFYTVYQ
jgi:hypothetical protein